MLYAVVGGFVILVGWICWKAIEEWRINRAFQRFQEEKYKGLQKTAAAIGGSADRMMKGDYSISSEEGNK